MMNPFEAQLEAVITEHAKGIEKSRHEDASDIFSETEINDLQTRCFAAIQRAAGKDSVYYEQAKKIGLRRTHVYNHVAGQIGVAKSLLSDIQNGYLKSFEEIIHGDVFGDFLEMAEYLTKKGYKDAGAITTGITLEAHLRKLCAKHEVEITSDGRPKKADTLNAELVKSGAYSKIDQKNVTAWLGLRNDAAHGNYEAYDSSQVTLYTSSIRDFITRVPA